jgi:hypothetical protein
MATEEQNDNIYIIVGRLVEAARSATESLKTLNVETRANSMAVELITNEVRVVNEKVRDLQHLVFNSDNPNNLLAQAQTQKVDIGETEDRVDRLDQKVGQVFRDKAGQKGALTAARYIISFLGWAVATAVSIYAITKGR